MKKLLLIVVIAFASLITFSTVSEAASVNPSTQTIYGSTQRADWNFTWYQGGAQTIRFNPADGSGSRVWDSNNTVGYSKIYYYYKDQSAWVTYRPSFTAISKINGTAEAASATVHKRLP